MIHIFEILPLNTMPAVKHGFSVTDVQLMTIKNQEKRYLAMIDSSMNIFIVHIGGPKDSSKTYKLGRYNFYMYSYHNYYYKEWNFI